MFSRKAILTIAAGAGMVTVAMGIRQAHPLLLPEVTQDLQMGRQAFGLTMAIAHIMFGLGQPFVGALSDRLGPARVACGGAVLYVLGLALSAHATTPLGLHLTLGFTIGTAMSACTFTVAMAAVGRVVPAERRGLAFGIVTAAGSFGMFALIPLTQAMLEAFGWRDTLLMQAAGATALVLLAAGLAGTRAPAAATAGHSLGAALREAAASRGYLLLTAGYFVCGFHVAFIGTHLPAYLTDRGADAGIAAGALALVGLFNIFGSFLFGSLGDRFRKKALLALIYVARAGVIAVFVALPYSPATALAFGATIGFLWFGTIPLTNGLVAQMFGVRHLGTLGGIVFLSHQLGSFCGAWGGGIAYDLTGSYQAVWLVAIALGLLAAALHLPIPEAAPARVRARAAAP